MIQLNGIEELTQQNIPELVDLITPVLEKRNSLYKRLTRGAKNSKVFYSKNNEITNIPFEQFINAMASGYFAGKKPVYTVEDNNNEERNKLIKEILGKDITDKDYKKKMEILIDYITKYNDDGTEHYNLTNDTLGLTSCYELLYENENNEIVYGNLNPLQTVAIWDYSTPVNLIGLVRKYDISDIKGNSKTIVEITDKNGTSTYSYNSKKKIANLIKMENHNWGDVPATVYESDYAIFETVVDLIQAFEQIIQNNRNTFQYNDDAKLGVVGYAPQNPMFTTKTLDDGTVVTVQNPDRIKEDNFVLQSKVVYFGEGGKMEWIIKNINDTATQNTIKTYMELITMMSCVPNITDTGFTNADNNSAIKNKYFALSQKLIKMRKGFEQMYLRRFELIFGRINLKKNTNFDFRDVKIDLPVNIPTNEQEEVDNILKLQGIISDETIISKLGYNYISEKEKMDAQSEENIERNLENIKSANNNIKEQEDTEIVEEETKQEEK